MEYTCKYDPKRDVKPVSPNGALDLKEAWKNKAIPANLQASEGRFNGIDDPSSIAGRVKDPLDAAVLEKQIRSYKAPEKTDE